jgi:hypothetical protein
MKNSSLKNKAALITALLFTTLTFGQNAPAFDKGDNTIGIGVGVGGSSHNNYNSYGYAYSGSYVNLPAFFLVYDHGTFPEVGPGTIGIGGTIAYRYSYLSDYGDYDVNWTDMVIGARGTYHLTLLKDKNNHFDPYGGVLIGMRFESYNNTLYDDIDNSYDAHRVFPEAGVFVGAKYNFTKNFGAFAEFGFDFPNVKIGLNFNF